MAGTRFQRDERPETHPALKQYSVSTKYRCHSPCHLEMSLLGGWGRAVGGRGAPA